MLLLKAYLLLMRGCFSVRYGGIRNIQCVLLLDGLIASTLIFLICCGIGMLMIGHATMAPVNSVGGSK